MAYVKQAEVLKPEYDMTSKSVEVELQFHMRFEKE
jgi:hypothetical protein